MAREGSVIPASTRRWASAFCALLLASLLPGLLLAETPSSRRAVPFAPGEELNFAVKYGVIRAGDAQLAVHEGEGHDAGAYRLESRAQSSRFFSTFFEVDDRVISIWAPDTRLPLRFEKRIREGSYKKHVKLRFDHAGNTVTDAKGKSMEILPGSQDVLSAFYLVRSQSLAPGDSLVIPNHSDGKNYMLTVKVHRRESIEVPAGKFNCVVVEPLLKTAGLFKQEGRLLIWLTEDSRRMPVRMESKVMVGAIVAELESFRMGRPPIPPAPAGVAKDGER